MRCGRRVSWLFGWVVFWQILGAGAAAHAKDLVDYVIEAVDPTLAPARPLIECLAGGGDASACAMEAAAAQSKAALPIGPSDDRVKKLVAVFSAVRDERWVDVVKIGGHVVAQNLTCALLPVQGPAKGPACSVIGWVLSKNVGLLDKTYDALKGPDWWALVDVLGTGVCQFIPSSGAAGAAKDVLCGAFAAALLEAKKMADQVAKGFVAGADALESAIFGDDSHMPYDTYFALYWQPWYQYAVDRILQEQSIGGLVGGIWGPCVDYFDSHNQYRKTAKKTCSNMRDKRFVPQVKAFAAAMPAAVDGYFETVARPAIRAAVLASYAMPTKKDLPGLQFFLQNCAFQIRARFPFPEPDDGRCKLLQARAEKFGAFESAFEKLAAKCSADVAKQMPSPSAWVRACSAMEPRYRQTFAGEALRLVATIGRLKKKGCNASGKGTDLRITCGSFGGYSSCLDELRPNGKKLCKKAIVATAKAPGGSAVGGVHAPPVPPPSPRGSTRAGRGRALAVAGAMASVVVDAEAEQLLSAGQLKAPRGQVAEQAMAGFGAGWSGGRQVLWSPRAPGESLELMIDVPRAGVYIVELYLTRAPDFAQLRFELDGKESRARFEGYASAVLAPTALSIGEHYLVAGRHRLVLRVAGKNGSSSGLRAGIDRARLSWTRAR